MRNPQIWGAKCTFNWGAHKSHILVIRVYPTPLFNWELLMQTHLKLDYVMSNTVSQGVGRKKINLKGKIELSKTQTWVIRWDQVIG